MPADAVMPGMQDREGEHREREDREQMDRAPWAPDAQLMDPERARRHRHHEQDPNPAKRAMGQRALGRGKLHRAEPEGGQGRKSMQLDGGRSVQQRCKRHGLLTSRRACGIA
jgi:hypothetical protein